MRDVPAEWLPEKSRWGTFSVRAHTDTRKLITDMLLYDILVFPSPSDDSEVDRWNAKGWDVELLVKRVVQLGDHAVVRPWDQRLRGLWQARYEAAVARGEYGDDLPFDTTTQLMAELSFRDLLEGGEVGEGDRFDDRTREVALHPPEVLPALSARDARSIIRHTNTSPELVAAFQHIGVAQVVTGTRLTPGEPTSTPLGNVPHDDGLRFRLVFAVPDDADEEAFNRAVKVLENDDFREARRRLWSWEKGLEPGMSLDDIAVMLDALLADYNEAVRRQVKAARWQAVFLLAPAVIGLALDQTIGGVPSAVMGAGASVLVDQTKLKFPRLQQSDEVAHHPGAALSGALTVIAHD